MDGGLAWKPDVADYRQCCVSKMSHAGFLRAGESARGGSVLPSGLREMAAQANFDASTAAVIRTQRTTGFLLTSPLRVEAASGLF